MNKKDESIERWHVTKGVPIALIVTLLIQMVGSIWYFRGLVSDIADTQRRVTVLESARGAERVSERLAVVESQVTDTKAGVLRIETSVQKLVERTR